MPYKASDIQCLKKFLHVRVKSQHHSSKASRFIQGAEISKKGICFKYFMFYCLVALVGFNQLFIYLIPAETYSLSTE